MTNQRTLLSTSATVRSGLGIFALGLVAVAVLSACGGGDAVRAPTSSTTQSAPQTFLVSSSGGTPTAQVAAGVGTLRYMIQGLRDLAAVSKDGTTAVGSLVYGTNNSIIGINGTHSLAATGSPATYAVQQFMGDSTFALGRWTKGLPTINGVVASTPLTGTDSTAVHYLITRDLPGFVPGNYPCNPLSIRQAGLTYSGNDGTTTPPSDTMSTPVIFNLEATINIAGGVATLSVPDLRVLATDGIQQSVPTHTVTFAGPAVGPQEDTTSSARSLYLPPNDAEGIAYVLGEGSTGDSITLGIAFRRALNVGNTSVKGPRYKGMAKVVCTKS